MNEKPEHFKGKDAVGHVAEAQARGILAQAESHSEELPGAVSAFADAVRDTGVALLLVWAAGVQWGIPHGKLLPTLVIFGIGWLFWKMGRSAWLGWARLERLHRILEEERWEIEHHRAQERQELTALYAAKGFEGDLLEQVIEVLMADEERLLQVMVEEELGLTLEAQDHPLKQAVGAGLGALLVVASAWILEGLFPSFGLLCGVFGWIAASAALSAGYEGNRLISAIVWAVGLAGVAFGAVFFLLEWFVP